MHTPEQIDHHFMGLALDLARTAAAAGEIPVGALIVHHPPDGERRIICQGFNQREAQCDASAHAEIVALRRAGRVLAQWRLLDCTMYVTLEPCPMCAGALVNARLPRLVYGCGDPKAGAVRTLFQLCSDPRLNHRLQVVPDVRGEEGAELLRAFFRERR